MNNELKTAKSLLIFEDFVSVFEHFYIVFERFYTVFECFQTFLNVLERLPIK